MGENYLAIRCDLTQATSVDSAITEVEKQLGNVEVYIHNAAFLLHKAFVETSKTEFIDSWKVTCLSAIHGIQRVIPNMLKVKQGTILVSGATASIKAGGEFSAFASAKFALRGLTQSLSREFHPQGIHIAHVILDGAIWGWQAEHKFKRAEKECLQPSSISDAYLFLIKQHHSAWTHELDLRPDMEKF